MGYRTFPADLESRNEDLQTGTSTESEGDSEKNETFTNVILGTDYHIDENNVISLTGHFAYEWEDEFSTLRFTQFDANDILLNDWIRDETTEATNPKWQYELRYQHKFPRQDVSPDDDRKHDLLISAVGNICRISLTSVV